MRGVILSFYFSFYFSRVVSSDCDSTTERCDFVWHLGWEKHKRESCYQIYPGTKETIHYVAIIYYKEEGRNIILFS